jgi:hypothetical protein
MSDTNEIEERILRLNQDMQNTAAQIQPEPSELHLRRPITLTVGRVSKLAAPVPQLQGNVPPSPQQIQIPYHPETITLHTAADVMAFLEKIGRRDYILGVPGVPPLTIQLFDLMINVSIGYDYRPAEDDDTEEDES